MAYKSLLNILTSSAQSRAAIDQAIEIAGKMDAHADVLCLGIDATQNGYYFAGANAMVMQQCLERAEQDAQELLSFARPIYEGSETRWSYETEIATLADLSRIVAFRARFADLVIQPQPYGAASGPAESAAIEAALFEGRAPVLVVPDGASPVVQPHTVLVAWNESVEALVAARKALPFLQAAQLVRIAVIDPPCHGPERSDPGGMLGQMLSRHGVRCEIDVLSKTMPRVSDILNRHTIDTNADMVVMGAYGHSRFRESILGGATRNMLEHAKVPVLMAH